MDWLSLYELIKKTQAYSERIELVYIMCDTQDINLLKLYEIYFYYVFKSKLDLNKHLQKFA